MLACGGGTACVDSSRSRVERQVQQLRDEVYALKRQNEELRRRVEAVEPESSTAAPPAAAAAPAARPTPTPALTHSFAGEPIHVSTEPSDDTRAAFEDALNSYRGGDHPRAIAKFSQFLTRHPQDAHAGEAQLLLGECYYASANFAQALNAGMQSEQFSSHTLTSVVCVGGKMKVAFGPVRTLAVSTRPSLPVCGTGRGAVAGGANHHATNAGQPACKSAPMATLAATSAMRVPPRNQRSCGPRYKATGLPSPRSGAS